MEILYISGIALLTFVTRIINLLGIPIFTDEAIYIRWAQIGLDDPAHRYISLTDGKQPLLTWLMYPFLTVFSEPLFAGRLVSVLSGVASSVGIYFLGKELFGRRVAVITSLLYIFSPYTLVYDRLALMDSLLAMLGIWSLYLSIMLVRKLRLDVALLLGITAGLGVLTKSSAFFFSYLLPFSLILFDWKNKNRSLYLAKWVTLALLSSSIAFLMYNSLRLSPWFYIIEQKNYSFIRTFTEFRERPFDITIPNLNGMIPWLINYVTYPVFLLILAAVIYGLIKKELKIVYLFLWFLLPFMALAVFGKVIFPRFFLFMTMPLYIMAAFIVDLYITKTKKIHKLLPLTIIAAFILPFVTSVQLIVAPAQADIPSTDRNQLLDDWPSGYGVKEVVSFIEEKSKMGKVVIGTEGTFGLFPAALELYLQKNPNVQIYGFWPVGEVPQLLLQKANDYPTYLVFKEKQEIPQNWPLKLVAKYRRGLGNSYLLFYQVLQND